MYLNGEQLVDLLVWPVNQYKIFGLTNVTAVSF